MAIISGSPQQPVTPGPVRETRAPADAGPVGPVRPSQGGDANEVAPRSPTPPGVPADQTRLTFRPFQLKRYNDDGTISPAPVPPALQEAVNEAGELDLKRVTPEMFNSMSPQERSDFLKLLEQQGSTGNSWIHGSDSPNADHTNIMGLDEAFVLHLIRQDPSGGTAARIFATNPDTIAHLHGAMAAGSDPMTEDANNLLNSLFGNLDTAFADTPMGQEHSQYLKRMASDHFKINERNPEAALELLSRADEAVARMPEETRNYNAGALAGTILAGLRDSGANPLAFLSGLPGKLSPMAIVASILGNAVARLADTTGDARDAYNQLFGIIREQFSQESSAAGRDATLLRHAVDRRDGFIDSIDWND